MAEDEGKDPAVKKRGFFKKIGPGIITAALVFGPGSLTINTKLGAGFGYSLIWVILLSMIFMEAFTRMSTKIGLTSKESFITRIREALGKPLAYIVGIGVFLVTASFQAGNMIGASFSFSELFGTSIGFWIILLTASTVSLLFFKSFYSILEKLMIGLVILMVVSFLLTIVMAMPDISKILSGMVPSIPKGSEYLIITLTASSFSIVGAFYQSYLVQEKGFGIEDQTDCVRDSRIGIVILGLLSSMVMVCAGAVLKNNNIEVKSAADLGLALEPLFGSFTSKAFMIGFFAASFSSMLGNATIGGVILSDTFFGESNLKSKKARLMIVVVLVIGALVAFIFGRLPLQFIIFASGITIMLVPITGTIILWFANSIKMQGGLKNSNYLNIVGLLGIALLLFMSGYSVMYLFF